MKEFNLDFKDLEKQLSKRDYEFLRRIYGDGINKYVERLKAINFNGLKNVLDAGCGFGQWTLALSSLNEKVEALDISKDRIETARKISINYKNIRFLSGSITELPYKDNYFDAIFCYSSIYYSNISLTIKEFSRVLKEEGYLYICSNDLGWYLYNIIKRPNKTDDFDPRSYGLITILDTLKYRFFKTNPSSKGSIITSLGFLKKKLKNEGLIVIHKGNEGTIKLSNSNPVSFFRGSYLGLDCCIELIARKCKKF